MYRRGSGCFFTGQPGQNISCGISFCLTLATQTIEENIDRADNDGDSDADEDDIEAQIKKEVEGMKPGSKKSRQLQAIRMDIPCGASNSLASRFG